MKRIIFALALLMLASPAHADCGAGQPPAGTVCAAPAGTAGGANYRLLGNGHIPAGIDATKVGSGAVSTTEYNRLDGITAFGQSLIDDADAATGRATLGSVIGTNVQAFDADLALFAAGSFTDPNLDQFVWWDDSQGRFEFASIADMATEGAPAAGDYITLYGAEGDVRKVNWSSLPGAGGGISNVVEDTSPTLGGDLEGNSFKLGTAASQAEGVFVEEGATINWDNGDIVMTQTGNVLSITGGLLSGASVDAATSGAAGVCELATNGEATTGTDTTRCVTPANVAAVAATIQGVPSGTVVPYAGSSAPTGWLMADGSAVSRSGANTTLFGVIGTTYGAGDGSTTMNLPNLMGRVPVGAGTGTYSETRAAANFNVSDTITVTSNPQDGSTPKWNTGVAVQVTTSGSLPTGISAATTYYVRRLSATTITLYSTLAQAIDWEAVTGRVNITATGSGNHTLVASLSNRAAGETFGSEFDNALLNHTHTLPMASSASGSGFPENTEGTDGSTKSISDAAGNTAENGITNMPPSIVLNYIIKIRVVTPRGVAEKMIWL